MAIQGKNIEPRFNRCMKVLLVHNAYQQQGGEEAEADAESQLLAEHGHEVIPYRRNNNELENISLPRSIAAGIQAVWASRSQRDLRQIITRERPDVAHFHNTFPLISPSAYYACSEAGLPAVQTLHNYRLLCPGGLLSRDGHFCEECVPRLLKWRGVLHGCYRDSRLASASVATMLAVHSSLGTWRDKIAQFIALSEFSRTKFVEGGLRAAKITVKPNFVSPDPCVRDSDGDYVISVGRLSIEKGADLLLKAWSKMSRAIPLRVFGDGPVRATLEREKAALGLANVSFEGALQREAVPRALKQSRFLVFSSQCYENFPLVIAEAYACGVPVVAPRFGAPGEIVHNGVTGLHFEAGEAEDLVRKVEWAWFHPEETREMGRAARLEYETKYTADRNYKTLMKIYERALA
jgi:glycosyltransferase involved in cell wall biosynthesis